MIEELKVYKNLGTPSYYWELFDQLRKRSSWTIVEVSEFFHNRTIDGRDIFDGCIPLLRMAEIIRIDDDNIKINFQYKHIFYSQKLCQQRLLKGILDVFGESEEFYDIFSSQHISYDYVYKCITVDFSAFDLKYANIRDFLIDFDFFDLHPDFPNRKLLINPYWKQFFDIYFVPEIRKRKISIKELRKKIEQQQINGEEAEQFILKFELKRLSNKEGIQQVSYADSSLGYDILSYNNCESIVEDRFIEVKSYSGLKPYFYWTKNEISVAKKIGHNYFVYLVNRDEMKNAAYTPEMIPNPVKNILKNKNWNKEVDKYYITKE